MDRLVGAANSDARRNLDMVTWFPQRERQRREMIRQTCREHGCSFLESSPRDRSPLDRLVVGLAMWSDSEIGFFEKLRQSSVLGQVPLEVFDMEDARTAADFQQFIPDGRLPLRTPVVGVVRNGRLARQLEGDVVLSMTVREFVQLLTD